jgi:hypothetical protein
MENLAWLVSGGFAKGYRTPVLGVTTALSAVALWAVGDMSLADLLGKLPIVLGGLGLAALGAKVDDAKRAGGSQAGKGKITAQSLARSCHIQALSLKVPPNMRNGAERCGR